jgi:acetate kinase
MTSHILVLNCGSSSIKFALFDAHKTKSERQPVWSGKVNGIGSAHASMDTSESAAQPITLSDAQPNHDALLIIRQQVTARLGHDHLVAVAHRVVHGGIKYAAPVLVDAAVLADLRSYIPLAPLHQPFALEAIEALLESNPNLLQVACFDTAFHHTLPRVEKMLPLSHAAWDRGLRRYGFHGLSYAYMALALGERYPQQAQGRLIVAHLGSGASLCAMRELQSVATTMGFSALDGLMMGTRTGAIDPGAVLYLMEVEKLSLEKVGHMLYHDSGLLGLSGVSSDPYVLLQQEEGNPDIQDALALYVRRIVREIGALVAVLGGLDMLVFTAGIGEHNAEIRRRICQGLGFLGLQLDDDNNTDAIGKVAIISAMQSKLMIAVEPTNEEWIAARHAAQLIQLDRANA